MVQSSEKSVGLSFKDLIIQLKNIKSQSLSGNLIVKVEPNLTWTLSFRLGRLGWVDGGIDPIGCWQRNLSLAQLSLPAEKLAQINNPATASLDSQILAELLVEELIDRQKCADLVARMTIENLFDIIQFSQQSGNRLAYQFHQTGAGNAQLNLVLPLLEIEPILTRSIQIWQEWSNAGLAVYAPSLFAIVSQSLEISQLDNTELNHTVRAIDGNRSLRSLAVNNRQSLIKLTTTILPLLRSGFVSLLPQPKSRVIKPNLSDLGNTSSGKFSGQFSSGQFSSGQFSSGQFISGQIQNLAAPDNSSANVLDNSAAKQPPLIACIDDSILIYQTLERILSDHGYRSYGVQDPLRIMPSLIRNKPDFIFLDLLMPITNGYEVCEQIRKTPSLKHIPVIILTGKDGLIDRMRSKMVGATGFLGKPVEAEPVLKMIEKYMEVNKRAG